MNEKIVEQKVVSRKDVGSANYFAKKYRGLKDAMGAMCMAPVLIIIAAVLLFYGEGFHKSSEVVGQLQLQTPEQVAGESGLVMISDKVNIIEPAEAPEVGEVLYYSFVEEEYQEVEETENEVKTVEENGRMIEETVETTKMVDKWVQKDKGDGVWADFSLGDIAIDPKGAKLVMDYKEKQYKLDEYDMWEESKVSSPQIGDVRMVVTYLDIDQNLVVVGELMNGKISGGDEFIISNRSADGLISSLKSEETFWYWFIKFIIWLLFTIGFTSILAPILALLDFIPLVGDAARNVAGFVAAVLSLLIVVVATILIKLWWLLLILIVLGAGGLMALLAWILISRKGKSEDQGEKKESN